MTGFYIMFATAAVFAFIGLIVVNTKFESAGFIAGILVIFASIFFVIGIIQYFYTAVSAVNQQIPPSPDSSEGSRFRLASPRYTSDNNSGSTPPMRPYGECERSQPISFVSDNKEKPLSGFSFSITGKMPIKRTNLICLIEHLGGEYHISPRKGTTYLICGPTQSGVVSAKELKAEKRGVQVIDAYQFCQMIGIPSICYLKEHFFELVSLQEVARKKQKQRVDNEQKRNVREGNEQKRMLMEIVASAKEIAFTTPLQVVANDGDDLFIAKVVKIQHTTVGDYVLFTTDGGSLYLEDLQYDSISVLLDIVERLVA